MKGRFPSDIAYISKDPRLLKQLKLPKEGENKQEKFKQPRLLKQLRLLQETRIQGDGFYVLWLQHQFLREESFEEAY